jgi:FkbM family methyltransferase
VSLAHVEDGLTLTVDLRRHVMFWSSGLARFEPCTVRALRATVERGDTVCDVGANIGFFATLLSRLVGPEGTVAAIEPEPENQALLRHNLESNGCANVIVFDCAVGSEPGELTFSLDATTGATGCLGDEPTEGELAVGTGAVRLIKTRVDTLDRIASELPSAPAVIKMDIEGAEILALAGASDLLRRGRPILLSELNGAAGLSVVGHLADLGYAHWDLETGRAWVEGDRPFMIAAVPSERLDEPRCVRLLAALARP